MTSDNWGGGGGGGGGLFKLFSEAFFHLKIRCIITNNKLLMNVGDVFH